MNRLLKYFLVTLVWLFLFLIVAGIGWHIYEGLFLQGRITDGIIVTGILGCVCSFTVLVVLDDKVR